MGVGRQNGWVYVTVSSPEGWQNPPTTSPCADRPASSICKGAQPMGQREASEGFTGELALEWPSWPLWQHTPSHYRVHSLWPSGPFLGICPKEIILTLKRACSVAKGTISWRYLVVLLIVLSHQIYVFPCARNASEIGGRKLNKNKTLPSKKSKIQPLWRE